MLLILLIVSKTTEYPQKYSSTVINYIYSNTLHLCALIRSHSFSSHLLETDAHVSVNVLVSVSRWRLCPRKT